MFVLIVLKRGEGAGRGGVCEGEGRGVWLRRAGEGHSYDRAGAAQTLATSPDQVVRDHIRIAHADWCNRMRASVARPLTVWLTKPT